MKSVVYELLGPAMLRQREQELDDDNLAKDEIFAVTEYSVVSTGTELAAWLGKPSLRPSTTYPRLVGYCNLARVARIGFEVHDVKVDDYILTLQSHRTAFICKRSDVLLSVAAIGDEVKRRVATAYLYHLGYAALMKGRFRPGHYVAVIGFGTLGATTASLSRAFGSEPLIFTNQEVPPTVGQSLGLRNIHKKVDPRPTRLLREFSGMDGVDLAIDTSNTWGDFRLAMQLARTGGDIVCLGFPGRGEDVPDFNPLDSQYFYDKQLSVHHCGYTSDLDADPIDVRYTLSRNIRFLSRLILDNLIDPLLLLSIKAPWTELAHVYETLASRPIGTYSALISWSE